MQSFMEESNIRWMEIIAAVCICENISCLVISIAVAIEWKQHISGNTAA